MLRQRNPTGSAAPPPRPLVLVVDDNEELCRIIEIVLSADGYGVRSAHTGSMGLAMAREELPNLVLLDMMMPELNGFEVLARLRTEQATRTIPIIVITCLGDSEPIDEDEWARRLEVECYLRKPFELETLRVFVHRFVTPPSPASAIPSVVFPGQQPDPSDEVETPTDREIQETESPTAPEIESDEPEMDETPGVAAEEISAVEEVELSVEILDDGESQGELDDTPEVEEIHAEEYDPLAFGHEPDAEIEESDMIDEGIAAATTEAADEDRNEATIDNEDGPDGDQSEPMSDIEPENREAPPVEDMEGDRARDEQSTASPASPAPTPAVESPGPKAGPRWKISSDRENTPGPESKPPAETEDAGFGETIAGESVIEPEAFEQPRRPKEPDNAPAEPPKNGPAKREKMWWEGDDDEDLPKIEIR